MGNFFSAKQPPPPMVLVPPIFDFPPLAARSRMLESSYSLLFGKLALRCLFDDYFEDARHFSTRIMLKPIDDPHVDLIATVGGPLNHKPEENIVGNAQFRWQSDVEDPHTFVDLLVSNSKPVLLMRSSAYYPRFGIGAFGIVPLLLKQRVSSEDYGYIGLRYGSSNLSVGATVSPFSSGDELPRNAWLVSKMGRLTAGVQYERKFGSKDGARYKNVENWSCAVGYGLGSGSPLSPSFNFGLELDKGSQFIATFYQHMVVQRRVKNPLEENEVVGITNYIDFGFDLQTRIDEDKPSNNIQDSSFQVAASWQANKNFLLKAKVGPLSSSLALAFKSWWKPSFTFSMSAVRDRIKGETAFGFGIRVDNIGEASYQRADPNFVMLTPNKEHLAEGIHWKIGQRPVLQSDVNSENFDGIPRELRPLNKILNGESYSGTGVVWGYRRHIVTIGRVVRGISDIRFSLKDDSTSYRAEFLWSDKSTDIAVLHTFVPDNKLKPIRIGVSANLRNGQEAFAIGHPPEGYSYTILKCTISKIRDDIAWPVTKLPNKGLIQTSAAMNPGYSGGPLLDSHGHLIGINTLIHCAARDTNRRFAIPADIVVHVVNSLMRRNMAIPISGIMLSPDQGAFGVPVLDAHLYVPRSKKFVQSITSESYGGLIVNTDIIRSVARRSVSNVIDLHRFLDLCKVGDTVTVEVLRTRGLYVEILFVILTTKLRIGSLEIAIGRCRNGVSNGTGFVWGEKRYIVTNCHVIEDKSSIRVTLKNAPRRYRAGVLWSDSDVDIAILCAPEIPYNMLTPIPIGLSKSLCVGEQVFAIGHPSGFEYTVTAGIISAIRSNIHWPGKTRPLLGLIQIDAPINPGNSGGPLLDMYGNFVGINSFIETYGGGSNGMGFAIPSDMVVDVLNSVMLGNIAGPISGTMLSPDQEVLGVPVLEAPPYVPYGKEFLQSTTSESYGRLDVDTDIIRSVNLTRVPNCSGLRIILHHCEIGGSVTVEVLRARGNYVEIIFVTLNTSHRALPKRVASLSSREQLEIRSRVASLRLNKTP